MHALCCVCSWWCVSASFQGALAEECYQISPDWGLALFSLLLKNLIYCPLANCNSQFAAPFLHSCRLVFFCFSLTPSSQCISLIGTVGDLNSAESLKKDGWRDWRSVKVRQSDWALAWLVWVSLACGGAPLCWMNGWDKIGDHWHLGVKGWVKITEKHASSVLRF